MIRSVYHTHDDRTHTDLGAEAWAAALQDPQGLLWVDFQGESPQVCEPLLRGVFAFAPLAVDDALQESHVPKIDDWSDYLYIVLHGIVFDGGEEHGEHIDTLEVDLFLGRNYVVSHHDYPIAAVDRVWASCSRDERHLKRGADYLAYRLADELVADYMPAVEEMEEIIDRLEDEVFGSPTPRTLERVFGLKRSLLRLRRIVMPQREVLNKLARGDFPFIDAEGRTFFRDVYDHLVRLNDINESMRDLLSGAMDIYLSVVNNRMNEIMKTLTIITTLFMPISFVAGFFGMNFFLAPADQTAWITPPLLAAVVMVMLLSPVAMYFWIRRRGWM